MKFEIGQLVRHSTTRDIGIVKKVDADYYGARQALKVCQRYWTYKGRNP